MVGRRWRLRHPRLPQCDHRTRWHRGYPDPKERSPVKRGLPSGPSPQRNPPRHAALWPRVLEAFDLIPRPQPRSRQDAVPQVLRRAHRRKRPRPPDRRNPHPHCTHEPLQCPRHRRDPARGLNLKGKGAITPHTPFRQQCHPPTDGLPETWASKALHGIPQAAPDMTPPPCIS